MIKEINLLTAKQVSEYLSIPVRTVQHLGKTGKLKSFKIGKSRRYLREDIEKFGPQYSLSKSQPNFLTAKEVSSNLCIHRRTLSRLSKEGKIKSVKIGGMWHYLKEDIEKYIKANIDFSSEPARKHGDLEERSEQRLYPRINTNFNCNYLISLPPFKTINNTGIIKNMSGGGVLLFEGNRLGEIEIGDPIRLDFVLSQGAGRETDISANGKVVRKGRNGIGIKFKDINKEMQNRIIEYAG